MWKTETEKILVLKAHYMGRMFVKKDKNLQAILDSINSAINELDHRNGKKDKIRQIFYILLKIEILRDSQDIIDLRKRAKEISEKMGSNVFNYFMAVQEVTSSKIKVVDEMQTGIFTKNKARIGMTGDEWIPSDSRNYSITEAEDDIFFDEPDVSGFVLSGPAVDALDLNGFEISVQEHDFLMNTRLYEILEKHGLYSQN